MTLLFSGDWQAQIGNLNRLQMHVNQLVKILSSYTKKGHTLFIHLGDVKEAFNPLDIRVQNFLIESFHCIRKSCNGFLYVRGNHDNVSTQDDVPSIAPLIHSLGARAVADVDWIKVPMRLLTWNPRIVRYCLIYAVPYFRDPTRQKKAFTTAAVDARSPTYKDTTCDAVGKDNVKILCFHQEVFGCQQSLYTLGTGLTPDDIGASVYDVCVGGHIHIPQHIPPNIHYVGSPFAMTWSEANTEHRILALTIDEAKP